MKQGTARTTAVPTGSCALALTSGEGSEQQRSPGHTVHGMQGSGFKSPQLHPHNPLSECPCPESMNAALRSGVMCQQVIPIGLARWPSPTTPMAARRSSAILRLGTPPSSSHVAFVCRRSCDRQGVSDAISSRQGRQVTLRRRGAAARSWPGRPRQWRPPPHSRGSAGGSDLPHAWHGRPPANATAPDPL
jgi:hypothetical protein